MTITSRLWEFGDGTTSTEQNPSKQYALGGVYNVSLTATNEVGTAKTTMVNAVIVDPCVANYTLGASPGGGVTQFVDTSTGTPTSWLWEFGDGATSTLQNPTHLFAGSGPFNIKLTAANAYSGSSITYSLSFIFSYSSTLSNANSYNMRNALIAAGWNEVQKVQVSISIPAGVQVGQFDTGALLPAGSTASLANAGEIIGPGGNGGRGSAAGLIVPPTPGSPGGTALIARTPISYTGSGKVAGGGGGGGGGGAYLDPGGGGGGGGGHIMTGVGGGGQGLPGGTCSLTAVFDYTLGAGTLTSPGTGSPPYEGLYSDNPPLHPELTPWGGNGGGLAMPGSPGIADSSPGAAGGAAGKAVEGMSFINSGAGITTGTVIGAQV